MLSGTSRCLPVKPIGCGYSGTIRVRIHRQNRLNSDSYYRYGGPRDLAGHALPLILRHDRETESIEQVAHVENLVDLEVSGACYDRRRGCVGRSRVNNSDESARHTHTAEDSSAAVDRYVLYDKKVTAPNCLN